MLDEVIEYLKQLQAQVQLMSSVRNISPQMLMSLGMQQQLQMSMLARMGMGVGVGMGMGMLDMSSIARASPQSLPPFIHPAAAAATAPTFVPPHFMLPPMIPAQAPKPGPAGTSSSSVPLPDPYALLAQV